MLLNKVNLRQIPFFQRVSMEFYFKNSSYNTKEVLIFSKMDCIFELNFMTTDVKVTYEYQ